jgi:hypothetical protein
MSRWITDNPGRVLALAMLSAAFLLLSGASDCSGFGGFCDFDSDCNEGRLCVEGECRDPCTSEQDCFGSDSCDVVARQAQDDTVQVCIPPEPDNDEDAGPDAECQMIENCCTTNNECQEALGDSEAVCGFDGRCVIPVEKHAVRLRGQTEQGAEIDDGHFGADIGAVFVRDAQSGQPLAFGRFIDGQFAEQPSVAPGDVLDGTQPELDATERCIAGEAGVDTFALGGMDGQALVSFYDVDGQRVRLDESMELVVVEWGANCYDETVDTEGFSVDFCRAFGSSVEMSEDCRRSLTGQEPVSGYVVIPLDGNI